MTIDKTVPEYNNNNSISEFYISKVILHFKALLCCCFRNRLLLLREYIDYDKKKRSEVFCGKGRGNHACRWTFYTSFHISCGQALNVKFGLQWSWSLTLYI